MKVLFEKSGWFIKENPPGVKCFHDYGRNKWNEKFLPFTAGLTSLADNKFVVGKDQAGRVVLAPGEDSSPRLLLFTGLKGGFRGGCNVHSDSTAIVLAQCYAGNACESALSVAAILSPGQKLVLESFGRYGTSIVAKEWDGQSLKTTGYSKEDYEATKSQGPAQIL